MSQHLLGFIKDPGKTPGLARKGRLRKFGEIVLTIIALSAALLSVVTTGGIIVVLFAETVSFFREVSIWDYLTGTEWTPTFADAKFGVTPLIAGTFMVAIGAGLIAVPLGLLSAIFLSEFASPRVRAVIKPMLEVLAGVPTVVYGYFGLMLVTPFLREHIFGDSLQVFNGLSGAIVVGIMILPLISSLCEDALTAVPQSLRSGGYALGCTKFEVVTRIVVPAALSGVMSAFILAISRAIGETMAVVLAAGATPKLTADPRESIQTMTAYIVQVSLGDTESGGIEYKTIFAVASTLFVITLTMNMFAKKLVTRFRQVYE